MRRFYFSIVSISVILICIQGFSYPAQKAPSAALADALGRSSGGIYFNDSGPELMILGNSFWEAAFRKSNGSIAYLTDLAGGGQLSSGSRGECLWGAVDQADLFYIGGCSYNKDWNNKFTYSWSSATHTLTFSYHTDPISADHFNTTVQIIASENDYFDMQMSAQEHYADSRWFDWMIFPSDLYFTKADVKGVLLPLLPGVVLKPGFFSDNRNYSWNYPGYPGSFADYIALSTDHGELAIYSIYNGSALQPVAATIISNEAGHLDTYYVVHNFGVMLKPDQTWISPLVRFRFSKTWPETILDYRNDSRLDAFTTIQEKLGPLYNKIIHMPVYRVVSNEVGINFSQYADKFFSKLRTPGILHPVAYQPGGHDHHSPDYLPPDTSWCNVPANCTQELADMFNQAKTYGWLVMPYINPTWWNPDGPTLQSLTPAQIKDISVQDRAGNPLYECYNLGSAVNCGYVVSPYVPFVEQRLDQFMTDMTSLVPSDLIFEDQIGARAWMFDFNPLSPSPTAYIQGWIEHVRNYKNKRLGAELAFDQLAETEAGFYGSVLLPQKLGQTETNWGDDNWSPYPLAQMMSRDKTLFYQHDLALETFSDTKANITWNLAMGYNLGDDLRLTEGDVHGHPWLKLNGELQDHLLADYAGERVTNYTYLAPSVTQTDFESFSVIANWDNLNPYTADGNTLAALGAWIQNQTGSEVAGILTAFNGQPLSAGDHYLIIKRTQNQIVVRQPMGNDTSLTLALPPGWKAQDAIQARALNKAGNVIATVPLTLSAQGITFTLQANMSGQEVEAVSISDANITSHPVHLPLVVR
jgi:Domain of unknown function (DUF6259)